MMHIFGFLGVGYHFEPLPRAETLQKSQLRKVEKRRKTGNHEEIEL